jgi:hypothetical protein
MDSDPARVDLVLATGPTPGSLWVMPDTDVATARALLTGAGAPAAVVLDRDEPVGVVTAAALGDGLASGTGREVVADVMDYDVVHVAPAAGGRTTVLAFRQAAWRSLLRRHPARLRQGPSPGGEPASTTAP